MKSVYKTALLGLAGLLTTQHVALAADLPSRVLPPPMPVSAPFFLFQDTTISYRFEPNAREPGIALNNPKNIAALTHVDAWAYGTNFGNVDFLSSSGNDPATDNAGNPTGSGGALEIYALYRGTLSGNALSNSKMFSYGGIIKDVSLGFGGDINTKDAAPLPRKRDLVIGPQISFDVPGFLTIEANLYKEWNRNSFGAFGAPVSTNTYADFRVTPEFEVTYLQPLTFTGLPLTFSGFLNVVLPKGSGGIAPYGANDTRTELLTSNRLTLDVGKVLHQKEHVVDLFVGYKYWYNKFGVNHKVLPGAVESTFFTGVALHVL